VFSSPRRVLGVSAVLGVAAIGLCVWAVIEDPIEYNFRNLRSVREESSRASVLNGRVKSIVGGSGAGQAIAVVMPSVEETLFVKAELERLRDTENAAFGKVRSLDDLLPQKQAEKAPLLSEIRKLLLDARRFAKPDKQKQIDENLPPENIQTLGYADLPEPVARPFTERDGTRGRVLFVEQQKGPSLWDGRYLVAWAEDLRKARMSDGTRPPLAGRGPVFADMIRVVWTDGPKAVLASFVATFLLVLFAFRRSLERFMAMFGLLLGILLMAGTMAAAQMKLNFLNFVAFPITFGNGVDYGVNVLRRFSAERDEGAELPLAVRRSIEETGGAVVLCSLTTVIGYSTLYVSANRALNSFGAAMAISEITCLVAAVLTVPALMLWRKSR
jgi:predicted exporter